MQVNLSDILTVSYKGPDAGLDRSLPTTTTMIESVVGERLTFSVELAEVSRKFEIVRTPPEAEAVEKDGPIAEARASARARERTMSGGSFAPNRPGLWLVRCTLDGGWSREIAVACFDAGCLPRLLYPYRPEQRNRLRALVSQSAHGTINRETVIDALEAHGNDGTRGINGRLVGGSTLNVAGLP